jgi:preprotein translocase subunit SecE
MAEDLSATQGGWTGFKTYLGEVRAEMKRVTWPSKPEVYGTTVMVVLTTFTFAAYFGLVDWVVSSGVQSVLDYFLHRTP